MRMIIIATLEIVSTSDFQSEVGEVFGEIGGELPAKFGRRFSRSFLLGKSSEAFSTKTPLQISPSNFTTRFWDVAGPRNCKPVKRSRPFSELSDSEKVKWMKSAAHILSPNIGPPQPGSPEIERKFRALSWAAANGGVTNGGGLRGVWPPFLEIGRNRPFSPFFCLFLGCRKWGFKRWGCQEIRGYLRKKAFSSVFWIFQVLFAPSGKGRKRQKKGEKGRFRPISGKGGQTPLKPPFVTPPFAAAQFLPFSGWSEEHLGNPENGGNRPFLQISSDFLKPPSLQPPFAALQFKKITSAVLKGRDFTNI